MLTIILAIIGVYIAVGIAVVVTINFAFVQADSRLRNVRDSIPLVFGWPIVLLIMRVLKP
ncbi:hypothetical protein J2Y67_004049 [Neobacillus niacini]|nr:hypothetical protein [Neobacillus niacini]